MTLLTDKAWKKVGMTHHHGIQVPLLSIHTQKSCGNGEFLDMIPLIDYLSSVGMDVLQILPLNDSGEDQSPYNALSSTALHPIYLSLHTLPDATGLEDFKSYNETKRVAYRQILERKLAFLRSYVNVHGKKIQERADYQAFLKKSPHLIDYGVYKTLKEKHNGIIPPYQKPRLEDADPFHLIVQFLCHEQLLEVKKHAEKKKVFLKGDVPILISPDSADVWAHPEFFDLTYTAGSPPNAFDPPGQNWKFPLYNWKAMEENHFEWWRKRIEVAAQYFHLYRVDHILGFFRIWAIPKREPPSKGHFEPSDPALMEAQGEKLLSTLVSFSDMLPIGEDLGDPPPFVRSIMKGLGIPGTKIFRRYRNWKTDRSFIPFEDYTPFSIASVSTHDIAPLALWWQKYPEEARDFANFKGWNYQRELSIQNHKEILYDIHHCGSLFHVNLLQEYLALTPDLTWTNPEDEQINIPGTESSHNWTYRYKSSIEDLIINKTLKSHISDILH